LGKKSSVKAKHLDFIIIDIFSVILSFWLAYLVWIPKEEKKSNLDFYSRICVTVVVLYIVLMLFNSFHTGILKRKKFRELWCVTVVNIQLLATIIALLFVMKVSSTYSRMTFGLFFIFDIVIMFLLRCIRKKLIWRRFWSGKNNSKVMVVTYPGMVERYLEALQVKNNGYYSFIGIMLLPDKTHREEDFPKEIRGIPVIAREDLLGFVKENVVNEVYLLAKHGESSRIADRFLSMGITTHIGLDLEIKNLPNMQIDNVEPFTVITTSISPGTPGELIIKRLVDIVVSVIGLLFTGILMIFLAPIIKKQSPGPVLFKQNRVGKNGKIFKMYKFRSMYMDAEERKKELMAKNEMSGLMFKMEDDPRIFPAGKFMRKTSLDEFPQFWNILKGDMSLVGTRPPTLDEFQQYSPHHLSRLAMKPGLTGLWQTSGRSDITEFEEVVRLDNEYIRNFSLGLDLKILVKTFTAVLKMDGSK